MGIFESLDGRFISTTYSINKDIFLTIKGENDTLYALKIQIFWRRYKKNQLKKKVKSAIIIQRYWKRYRYNHHLEKNLNKISMIQTILRLFSIILIIMTLVEIITGTI